MPDLLDLLGGPGQQDKHEDDSTNVQSEKKDDGLDFLSQFKKRATGEVARSENPPKAAAESSNAGGITPLDIAGLPDAQKHIMFALLRDKDASQEGLTLAELHHRFDSIDNLAEIIEQLAQEEWLLVLGTPPDERYKLNLRRRKGRLSSNVWAALSD